MRLYLYQTLHCYRGRPRQLEAHAALIGLYSERLFGRPYRPDLKALEERVVRLLQRERCPSQVSTFVRLEVDEAGEERLTVVEPSLYGGYALRALQPEAALVRYENPMRDAPTTAREAAAALARYQARLQGAEVAIRCTADGVCMTADDAPLFGVYGQEVWSAPAEPSVERAMAVSAIRMAGLTLHEEPFDEEGLRSIEELFYVDHRGVTSISRCHSRPYMSILAERVAAALERQFR